MAAERGLDATGVDAAPSAIAAANRKAAERVLTARFLVWDALRLAELGEQFDTVLDSGLFHVFDDERRHRYVDALAAAVRPGGHYFMCCFSDRQPGDWGPRQARPSRRDPGLLWSRLGSGVDRGRPIRYKSQPASGPSLARDHYRSEP